MKAYLYQCPCGAVRKRDGTWVLPRLSLERIQELCRQKQRKLVIVPTACPPCIASSPRMPA